MSDETSIRLAFFFGVFVLVAAAEIFLPCRSLTISKAFRWANNMGIVLLDVVLVRLLFPVLPVGLALLCLDNGWGLLNNIALPYWLEVLLGVVVLDMIIYFQHVTFHSVPALWRLHMVHHADLDFDLTTGLRFHPVEIILSMGIKLAAVAALGTPALSVIVFEVLLNSTAMFNHGNLRIPPGVDRILRYFVVTPDMHRVHHSVVIHETNSNFGFNLPWWDRLFGTYRNQPVGGHVEMNIGLHQFRDAKLQSLHRMLALPFVGLSGDYDITRQEQKSDAEQEV